mgnify:CR=1 FL=1
MCLVWPVRVAVWGLEFHRPSDTPNLRTMLYVPIPAPGSRGTRKPSVLGALQLVNKVATRHHLPDVSTVCDSVDEEGDAASMYVRCACLAPRSVRQCMLLVNKCGFWLLGVGACVCVCNVFACRFVVALGGVR